MISFSKIATFLFGFIALLHLLRLIFKIEVSVGNYQVPQWMSIIGLLFFLFLCIGIGKEQKVF